LTPEQKEDRHTSSQDIIAMADVNKNFLTKLLREMRPGVLLMTPKTKRQNSEWVGETSPRPKKLKFQRSRIKIILILFFDSQGVVHKEFVPEGKTGNAECLLKRISRVRPAAFCSRDFLVAR
jgi:hypothetical protein